MIKKKLHKQDKAKLDFRQPRQFVNCALVYALYVLD